MRKRKLKKRLQVLCFYELLTVKRKKIVILPKLNDAGGNLSKKWFVYYSVRDPRTDKMERFKDHVR